MKTATTNRSSLAEYMCGITGIWNFNGEKVTLQAIERFTDSLRHRGPDRGGTWIDDDSSIALGHRRLAILDLSEQGNQPMSYADGRYWITFNGEIYNFVELRSELETKGYRFRSHSDTEVILAAYEEWGEKMLHRFDGMWAFAVFDRKKRTLFLARDRFGIKPLNFRLTREQLAFASELKAFKYLEGYNPEIDREAALASLYDGFCLEGSKRTMLKGVFHLQGGHYGIVEHGRVTIKRWWNSLDHLPDPPPSFEKQVEQFRELFYDAVRLRMRSDVPIGSCLSGGFDSSAVVCALAEIGRQGGDYQRAPDWQQTFIATFPGAFNDEKEEAEEVVQFSGVKGNFFPVGEDQALIDLDTILYDLDDLYLGLPTAPWLIYKELRDAKVVVSLDGHGADELMGAYLQADQLLFHQAPSLLASPVANMELIRQYRRVLRRLGEDDTLKAVKPIAKAIFDNHPSLQLGRNFYSQLQRIKNRLIPRNSAGFLRSEPQIDWADFKRVGQEDVLPENWGPVNRRLYSMFHSDTLPTILRNFDRISMAHGIEIRMPFMDWRLVCYVLSLPDSSKVDKSENKRVAREAMRTRMPERIRTAKHKIGFVSPMPEWFNGPLRPWIDDIIGQKDVYQHDLINGGVLVDYVHTHMKDRSWTLQECFAVWPLINFLWFEKKFLKN